MAIKALLFDMDGVVIDSEPLYQRGEIRLFDDYGINIPDADWALFRGSTEAGFYKMVQERYQINEDPETLRKKGRAYVLEEFASDLDYMQGFQEMASALSPHYNFGLVTATPKDIFEWVDQRLNLRQYFPQIIWGGMTENGKPHPEPYLKMMKMMNVTAGESIVIEDSIHGVNAGLNAEAKVIALTGSVPEKDLPPAHKIINRLDEINISLINQISEQ